MEDSKGTENLFTTEEVETLIEVGVLLSSNLRLEEVLEIAMEQAVLLVKAEVGIFWLNQQEKHGISPVGAYGLDNHTVNLLRDKYWHVVNRELKQQPYLIRQGESEHQELLDIASAALYYPINTMVLMPLISKGRTMGCLQLLNKQDGSLFGEKDCKLCSAFASQAAVIIDNSRLFANQEKLLANQEKLILSMIRALSSALDARDPYTRGHSERVSRLAVLIGQQIGMDSRQSEVLQQAALLHDVGKIGISDDVLLEPGPLNEEKWRVMKSHPDIGAQIIDQIEPKSLMQQVYEGVLYHQERFDGSGYPSGLKGEEIPKVARIIAIADAFDAITSDRPYRKGKSPSEGLEEIKRCSGKHFDPDLVQAFLRAMEIQTEWIVN